MVGIIRAFRAPTTLFQHAPHSTPTPLTWWRSFPFQLQYFWTLGPRGLCCSRALCSYGGWSFHREPYLLFHQFFPAPLFLRIGLVAFMLDLLCDWCPMSSLVYPFLLSHSLAFNLDLRCLCRCRNLGCHVYHGVTSACLHLSRYVSQPSTSRVAWSLFVGVYFTLPLRLLFFPLCVNSPLFPFFHLFLPFRVPPAPCAAISAHEVAVAVCPVPPALRLIGHACWKWPVSWHLLHDIGWLS